MHVEIQVALNFLISFLYNKLPRRRVNQFGEELEAALKAKFAGHWYPEAPAKGSAYRCLKTANPLDPVFEIAARNCGLELIDIQEYLPSELTIWVEPGEVSYRMSEKSPVKLLYQENEQNGVAKRALQPPFNSAVAAEQYRDSGKSDNTLGNQTELTFGFDGSSAAANNSAAPSSDQSEKGSNGSPGTSSNHSSTSSSVDSGFTEVDLIGGQRKVRSFNPEAQCFKPIESSNILANSFSGQTTANQYGNGSMLVNNYSFSIQNSGSFNTGFGSTTANAATAYFSQQTNGANANPLKSPSSILPATSFTKPQAQTMTTAQFAQTKFGSTKLKTTNNSSTGAICGINGTTKRNYSNRMSPTEFSNYIKQRAILQQQQQQSAGITNLSQSLNGGHQLHQLQVPAIGGAGSSNNFAGFGNLSLFNGLSPQQSRSISPISNQDNFLLMAAAAVTTNGPNASTNSLNNSIMRNTLGANTSPISAAAAASHTGLTGLNSSGNSICSSLSSNSGSTSLMLNGNGHSTSLNQSAHLLSPSSNSAPGGDSLLSDISYLSELFNNTSLSPILGHSASLSTSNSPATNTMANGLNGLNSSLNSAIKPPVNGANGGASLNRFNPTPTSFLELNATNFGNYTNLGANSGLGLGGLGTLNSNLSSNLNSNLTTNLNGNLSSNLNGSLSGGNLNSSHTNGGNLNSSSHANGKAEPQFGQDLSGQQANEQCNPQQPNNQNSPKTSENNENKQFDSYSMSNGVIYPNQYQHLLVAN